MALTWKKRRAFPSTADQEPRSGRTPWFSAAAEGERDLQTRLRGRGGTREGGGSRGMVSRVRGSSVFFFPSPFVSGISRAPFGQIKAANRQLPPLPR
jgi:hypothetical protein